MNFENQPPSPYVFPGCRAKIQNLRTAVPPQLNSSQEFTCILADDIIETVTAAFEVEPDALKIKTRIANIVMCRQVIYYMASKLIYKATLKKVGCLLGLAQNHTTVIHSIKKVKMLLEVDREFRETLFGIELQLHHKQKTKMLKQFVIN